MKVFGFALIAAVLLTTCLLTGCGSADNKTATASSPAAVKKPESKEPALYTAQEAFTRLVGYARLWAPDAMPVQLESDPNSESNGQDGKASVWRGMFASPSRRVIKTFICSGSRLPDAPVFGMSSGGAETAYAAGIRNLMFEPFFLKTDSDKAFAIAQEHGGAKLVKKDPKQPVAYMLEWDPKTHAPLWYVVYGKTTAEAKGVGVINATTGKFVRAGK